MRLLSERNKKEKEKFTSTHLCAFLCRFREKIQHTICNSSMRGYAQRPRDQPLERECFECASQLVETEPWACLLTF